MEGSDRSLDKREVPLVAIGLDEHHHPSVFSKVMLVRPVQPENAEEPMLVTLSGIVMLVRLEQFENAPLPMIVTPLPIVTLVRFSQESNA